MAWNSAPPHSAASDPMLRLHLREPDYTRPLLCPPEDKKEKLLQLLERLYGSVEGRICLDEIIRLMQVYYAHKTPEMIADDADFDPAERFTERDVILITYGDLVKDDDKPPLRALADALETNREFGISTVHILPFHPYSSDRGFSVVDYREVDPRLGTWEDIEQLGLRYRLMFDGVFNHISAQSRWFREFLNGNPRFRDHFIKFSTQKAIPEDYLQLVLRPRTSDLLTGFDTIRGRQYVWTTFSPDQVDLNFRNPEVLVSILEVLLEYVSRGADIVRLDAVTYIWTELGTSCALLEESHVLVRLFRAVLDVVAPRVALVTETNVPHEDNVSYFGDGANEAQMVYNFALPPLVLHTFQTGDCRRLSAWAASLDFVSATATYFNFLDSHDGIGLLPVRDILEKTELEAMIERARRNGALISYRNDESGEESPYEINTTWFSALNQENSRESLELRVDRFLASRAIALTLMGVPGIYLPSLVGTVNDTEAVLRTGEARSINRGVLDLDVLRAKVADPGCPAYHIFRRFGEMIRRRVQSPAFHPNASQRIITLHPAVFSVLRDSEGDQPVLALVEVAGRETLFEIPSDELPRPEEVWRDLLSWKEYPVEGGRLVCSLRPYEVIWLTPVL
jgi:glucosylglycerate phosphorylase